MKNKTLFITSVVFLVAFVLFVVAIFTPLRIIFSPFVATIGFVYFLSPPVNFFVKLRIKRLFSVFCVYAILLTVLVVALLFAFPVIYDGGVKITELIYEALQKFDLTEKATEIVSTGAEKLFSTAMSAVSGITAFVVGAIAAFYILVTKDSVKEFTKEFIPLEFKPSCKILIDDIKMTTDSFFKGQMVIAGILFLIDCLFLYCMKVPYALTLSAVAALLDIIPYAGAFVGAGIILLIVIISVPEKFFIVLIGLLIIQQIENHVITPKISSDTLEIHPAVIILSLYVGAFGGFWGILLAVPLTCIFRKICARIIQSIM